MFVLALLLAAVNSAPSPQPAVALDDRLSAISDQNIQSQHAPGGAVAIVRDGTVIFAKGFGLRNIASSEAVDTDTQFEIGSVTKQFTAAAILQLKEQGKLGLDDKLAKYVPSFPHASRITLRQLLNQTSGLPNYTDVDHFVSIAKQPGSFAKIEALIAGAPLHFKPGTKWEYSNTNYVALGRVVEVVSRQSYASYMQTHIFGPVGMAHSAMIADEPAMTDFATPYWRRNSHSDALSPSQPLYDAWAAGAGAIVSTAGDLARWDVALQGGKVVTPADFTLMTTSGRLANGSPDGYGFGWQIDSADGQKRIWHNGGTFGSSSSNVTFPAQNVDIIVLENEDGAATSALATKLYEAMFPEIAAAAIAPGQGEDAAVTARAKTLIEAAIKGVWPADQLSPLVREKISPAQQQQIGQQLSTLGAMKDLIFKKKIDKGDESTYLYRVDFANSAVNFSLTINKNNNLVDGIWFGPA